MRSDVDIDVLLAGPLDEDDLGGGDDLAALEAQPHARHAGGAQDEWARDHGAGLNTQTDHTNHPSIQRLVSDENNIFSENGNNIVGLRLSTFVLFVHYTCPL